MVTISYNHDSYMVWRAISIAWEGVKPTPTVKHEANLCEKIGDGILYVPERIPRTIKNLCTDPQAITLAVFAAGHLANSYAFYPEATVEFIDLFASYIPQITQDTVRFCLWSGNEIGLTGYCCRAVGRLKPAYVQKFIQKSKE